MRGHPTNELFPYARGHLPAQMTALSAKDLLEVFAMDNRSDIETICDVLEREHSDIAAALVRDQAGPRRSSAVGAAGLRRRSSAAVAPVQLSTPLSDHEEVHTRIGVIEETLRMCDAEVRSIQEHLNLLPQLCELLNIDKSQIE